MKSFLIVLAILAALTLQNQAQAAAHVSCKYAKSSTLSFHETPAGFSAVVKFSDHDIREFHPSWVTNGLVPIAGFKEFLRGLGNPNTIIRAAGVDAHRVATIESHFVLIEIDDYVAGIFVFRDSDGQELGTVANFGARYDDGLVSCGS